MEPFCKEPKQSLSFINVTAIANALPVLYIIYLLSVSIYNIALKASELPQLISHALLKASDNDDSSMLSQTYHQLRRAHHILIPESNRNPYSLPSHLLQQRRLRIADGLQQVAPLIHLLLVVRLDQDLGVAQGDAVLGVRSRLQLEHVLPFRVLGRGQHPIVGQVDTAQALRVNEGKRKMKKHVKLRLEHVYKKSLYES